MTEGKSKNDLHLGSLQIALGSCYTGIKSIILCFKATNELMEWVPLLSNSSTAVRTTNSIKFSWINSLDYRRKFSTTFVYSAAFSKTLVISTK